MTQTLANESNEIARSSPDDHAFRYQTEDSFKMHSDLRTNLWIGRELANVECRMVKDIVSGF